jgi:hypothetical protein
MADHVFGDEDRDVLATVMDRDSVANHGWDNH